jgi:uncharacterized protein
VTRSDNTAPDGLVALKEALLVEWLRDRRSVLIGYSGGVDSTYLALMARLALGRDRTLAVLGRSASVPAELAMHAARIASEFDIPLRVVDTGEVSDPRYAANPVNRCYFCKSVLWEALVPMAKTLGIGVVVDGTNAGDVAEYRPGAKAAREQGIESPLADVGLTKTEIRELSKARGLPTWSQPSAPCLASRIPYGTAVTVERLGQVERAEHALRALGIEGDLRVRHHQDLARVELSESIIDYWLEAEHSARLVDAVRGAGFARVALDLRGFRSGSLNVLEGIVAA